LILSFISEYRSVLSEVLTGTVVYDKYTGFMYL